MERRRSRSHEATTLTTNENHVRGKRGSTYTSNFLEIEPVLTAPIEPASESTVTLARNPLVNSRIEATW